MQMYILNLDIFGFTHNREGLRQSSAISQTQGIDPRFKDCDTYDRGYSVEVADQFYNIYALVKYLSTQAAATGTLITILDYCLPEPADVITALTGNTEAYTARAGRIYNVAPKQGSVGTIGTKHYVGFGFKFQEALVREEP